MVVELVYRLFLKIKYKKALNFLEQFYDVYKSHWADTLDLESAQKIEKEVLNKIQESDQRYSDMQILGDPRIVASYYKVEKQILNEEQDMYFLKLSKDDKNHLLRYLLALRNQSEDKIALLKITLDKNLDFAKIPNHYFNMSDEEIISQIQNELEFF